jgi:hypothetical protein
MRGFCVAVMMVVLVGCVWEARADIDTEPYLPGGADSVFPTGADLYWRDNSGAPNDSVVHAVPGETVFIQLMVNTLPAGRRATQFFLDASWGSDVVDTSPSPLSIVTVDTDSYMTFRDPIGHGEAMVTYGSMDLDSLTITFPHAYLVMPLPIEGDTGGPPIEGLTPEEYVEMYGGGGIIAGFWVPIRSDAVVGSSTKFNVAVNSTYLGGLHGVWSEDFTETGPFPELVMTINVVPEPATIAVMAIGAAALLRRRRRK